LELFVFISNTLRVSGRGREEEKVMNPTNCCLKKEGRRRGGMGI
jgi:hypothetical protein